MINKFSNYDTIQIYESGLALEAGGYELIIKGARVEEYGSCTILKVAFDIVNNERYNDYFKRKHQQAKTKNPEAKWPNTGIFDVFIPKDDGTEKDELTKQSFKRFITSVEKSNQGYTWNWDERTLINKMFGGVFGRVEYKDQQNEEYRFAVKCRFTNSIDRIRSGDFTIPKDKLTKEHRNNNVETPASIGDLSDYEEILNDGDVPF